MFVCVTLQLAGVHATTMNTFPDGTFDLDQFETKIRHGYPDPHYPRSRLICVENTHNIQGGRVLPLTFLQQVTPLWQLSHFLLQKSIICPAGADLFWT